MTSNDIVSLFSGCGGLDLGFTQAGFNIIWANENDKTIWSTYEMNHPKTQLVTKSIVDIDNNEVPDCDGIIGGPPCQSWSEAGAQRGINDSRGQLFYEYIRILEAKKPKFFLAENVSGMLAKKHKPALDRIISLFDAAGYHVVHKLIDAQYYNVPQTRKRVIFVGYRKDLDFVYQFPSPSTKPPPTLRDAIWNLRNNAKEASDKNHHNPKAHNNHEYMTGAFSTIYMSRNRVRSWGEQSYTIQAGGRHAPIHPGAPKMFKRAPNKFEFWKGHEHKYRRLSVRECAEIQTFPKTFQFLYKNVGVGYKMIGNAVPVEMAKRLASPIYKDLKDHKTWSEDQRAARKPTFIEQLPLDSDVLPIISNT